MALDVAEHLSNKFLRSLDEADSQLSGSTFISDFLAIKNVVNQIKRPRPRTCSETIRLLYDLNDALEECRMVPHKGRDLNMRLFLFSPSVYVFIQKMKTRLNKIKQGLGNLAAAPQQKISNRGFSLVRPPQVIGFDDLAEKIEGFLLGSQGGSSTSSRTGFATIGVFGIAGVGKTTLVQKVLDSERVKAEFNPIIWLPFSGMREELQQLSRFSFETCIVDNNLGPSPSPMSTDIDGKIVGVKKMLEKLNQLLSGKRYLIVFDDVYHSQIHVEE